MSNIIKKLLSNIFPHKDLHIVFHPSLLYIKYSNADVI